jgi:hypothetical protein
LTASKKTNDKKTEVDEPNGKLVKLKTTLETCVLFLVSLLLFDALELISLRFSPAFVGPLALADRWQAKKAFALYVLLFTFIRMDGM